MNASCPRWSFLPAAHFRGFETQAEEVRPIWLENENRKLRRPKLLMQQYGSKNRGGSQSCIRLLSPCNLTEMILNHWQKLRAWCKYGDFPFFPLFSCGRTGSIYRDWLMRLQITADSVWGNEKRHRWEATTSNSARTPLQFPPSEPHHQPPQDITGSDREFQNLI